MTQRIDGHDNANGGGYREEPVAIPIDGVLDLHAFQPREIPSLIGEYLALCLEKKIMRVRIIHGKGTGTLRRTVHAILARHPRVATYGLAAADQGSWGATEVVLADHC